MLNDLKILINVSQHKYEFLSLKNNDLLIIFKNIMKIQTENLYLKDVLNIFHGIY